MIGAIVLAAGASSRMGSPKAQLELTPSRRTFLEAILETLTAAGVSAVRVVVAPGLESPPRGSVVNPDPDQGMLSSIHCGLRALPRNLDAVFVWPVDHPLVDASTVTAMIDAFRTEPSPIVVPTYEGRRGHPVLFSARVIPEIFSADRAQGARAVVHAHGDRRELPIADRGIVEDIDTPEDYARLFGATVRRTLCALAVASLLLLASCSAPPQKSEAERTVTDPARGVRYVVPPGWKSSDGEVRSRDGSLLTLRVYDLVEADKRFVAGLPDTLVPQLLEWAQYYYIVDGPPIRTETTVAGLAATEFVYPTRVRPKDPPSKVMYWVVIRKTRLFVLRAAFPAEALAADEPILRNVVAGWGFLDETDK